mmetsp:Transcript_75638/g.179728  ORF Transcript_75638/g.179728 Transcript_75638/m.179728 type:complete len:658 (-) Transcript_75638:115-2088(-)
MMCQKRLKPMDCNSDFARAYNSQAANPLYDPPYNAPKNDSILRCRRNGHYESEPHLGYPPVHEGGYPEYCVFLSEATLAIMKQYEWLDDLTEDVSIYLMVYTPGLETVSLVHLHLAFSEAGRIWPMYSAQTYLTVTDSPRFEAWLVLQFVFLLVVITRLGFTLRWLSKGMGNRRILCFDVVHTAAFAAFSLTCLYRIDIVSMLDKAAQLHVGLTSGSDISAEGVQDVVSEYFSALQTMLERSHEESVLRWMAFSLVAVCFVRLIMYMSVHPRVDVISQTLMHAANDTFHFIMVFLLVFFLMAWLAQWSFGDQKEKFSTFTLSLNTCFQMLIGEYPFEHERTEGPFQKLWYFFYTVLVFFISVNVFLAIIVEAFLKVKGANDGMKVASNFVTDFAMLVMKWVVGSIQGWPSTSALVDHFEIVGTTSDYVVTVDELLFSRFARFPNRQSVELYLEVYHYFFGEEILGPEGMRKIAEVEHSKVMMRYVSLVYGGGPEFFYEVVAAVERIQRVWRGREARRKANKRAQRVIRSKSQSQSLGNFMLRTQSLKAPLSLLRHSTPTCCPTTVSQVKDWILQQGHSAEVANRFEAEAVDGVVLQSLTEADLLNEFDVKPFGKRRQLMLQINNLKNNGAGGGGPALGIPKKLEFAADCKEEVEFFL